MSFHPPSSPSSRDPRHRKEEASGWRDHRARTDLSQSFHILPYLLHLPNSGRIVIALISPPQLPPRSRSSHISVLGPPLPQSVSRSSSYTLPLPQGHSPQNPLLPHLEGPAHNVFASGPHTPWPIRFNTLAFISSAQSKYWQVIE